MNNHVSVAHLACDLATRRASENAVAKWRAICYDGGKSRKGAQEHETSIFEIFEFAEKLDKKEKPSKTAKKGSKKE